MRDGRRVLDEGRGGIAAANALSRGGDPTGAWLVLDGEEWDRACHAEQTHEGELNAPMPLRALRDGRGRFVQAESVARLAEAIGLDPTALDAEIEDLSVAVAAHRGEQLPIPRTGGQQIRNPPFYAIPVTPGITFTMGGLRIDDCARVLDSGERAIPGLLAAGGSAGGLQGCDSGGYVGGLAPALVFGVIAGEQAATAASCSAHQQALPNTGGMSHDCG